MRIGINDGHTLTGVGSGAIGFLNESNETRRIGNEVRRLLKEKGHEVINCTVDKASTVTESLSLVTAQANRSDLDMFVAIHLNASGGAGYGVEVYTYKGRQFEDAIEVCANISELGFRNRGVKDGTGLYVVGKTNAKAMLIEVCFCDNKGDSDLYNSLSVTTIASAIANAIDEKINVEYGKPIETPSQPSKPVEETPVQQPHSFKYTIGQKVKFSTCYTNAADAVNGVNYILASKMARDTGTITKQYVINNISAYLLDNGLCFVNDGDIREVVTGSTNTSTSTQSLVLKENAKVVLSTSAKTYATGQAIPDAYKGKTYTIQQVGSGKVLLKELYSWVNVTDLVGGANSSTTSKKSAEEVAKEIINKPNYGGWGTGEERKKKLRDQGYNPDEVQAIINKLL